MYVRVREARTGVFLALLAVTAASFASAPVAALAAAPVATPAPGAANTAARSGAQPGVRDEHVIVRYRQRPTASALQRQAARIGAFTVRHRYVHVNAVAATVTAAQMVALRNDATVASVEPDRTIRIEPVATAAPSAVPGQWFSATPVRQADKGLNAVQSKLHLDGDSAHDGLATYGPGDEVVAVVDSGIDAANPDLAGGKILAFQDFVSAPDPSCPVPPNPSVAWDDLGHGTHVAGIVAGTGKVKAANKGVAPGAALVALKVFDCTASAPESQIALALDWILSNHVTYGIDVVNMSFGAYAPGLDGTDLLAQFTNQLAAAGLVPVVAAGNNGPTTSSVNTPGVARWSLTAGAIKSTAIGRDLAQFSSRGLTGDGRVKPDVMTPGVDILSTGNITFGGLQYRFDSGTSMAAPFLSGLAALALQADPALAPSGTACDPASDPVGCADGVVDASMQAPLTDLAHSKAVDWNTPGPDGESGWGVLNAYPFLQAAAHSTVNGPAYPKHAARQGHVADRGEQLWAVKAAKNAVVSAGVTVPGLDSFNGPFTGLVALDANGAPLTTTFDCAGGQSAYGVSAMCQGYGFAQRFNGMWFVAPAAGTYYVGVRSLTGPVDYVLDIDGAAKVGSVGTPIVAALGTGTLAEGAGSRSLSVSLGARPAKKVVVHLAGDGELTLPATTLTFTPTNWSVPQTLSVSAYDDLRPEGVHTGRLTVLGAGTPFEDSVVSVPLAVPIADNDVGPATPRTERVSLTDNGAESWGGAYEASQTMPMTTPDGSVVAFESRAVDLDPTADPNGIRTDVFVRDRATGHTERVSAGNVGDNFLEGISDDGRYVLFSSYDALVANDTNNDFDLYVRDRVTHGLTRVDLGTGGAQMPARHCRSDFTYGFCMEVPGAISGDGHHVAFVTDVPMVASDTDNWADVYVRDLVTGAVQRASVANGGTPGTFSVTPNPYGMRVALSHDGDTVLFSTAEDGLSADDRAGEPDLFTHVMSSAVTTLVNRDASGAPGNLSLYTNEVHIAGNGGAVAYALDDPSTYLSSVWSRTLATGAVERVDPASAGAVCATPTGISTDGRTITFATCAPEYSPEGYGTVRRDLDTGAWTEVAAVATARLSADGNHVAWVTNDASVVSGDVNWAPDVFLRTL